MRIFLVFVLFVILGFGIYAQSPHGSNFNLECSDCHSELQWIPLSETIKFNHSSTGFELTGQHKTVGCNSCHETLVFNKAEQNCLSCHKDIHQNSVSKECATCHNTSTWIIPNITELHQRGRFPLLGSHLSADCSQCHSGYADRIFEPKGIECYDCHKTDFEKTVDPNHISAGFSIDCSDCHSISRLQWAEGKFVHDFFPLTDGHQINECSACHSSNSFTGLNQDCYGCHQQDFQNPNTVPNHITANFSQECKTCHTTNGWQPAQFDHGVTAFPLTGKHTTVNCASCHSSGYTGTSQDCYSCHQNDFQNPNNDPNHITANFSHECKTCHTTNGWLPTQFDHGITAFPLTGKHSTVNCASCHSSGYTGTSQDCYSCHQQDFQNPNNDPNHIIANFSQECKTCHTTVGWQPTQFDHGTTAFPLTGKHTAVSCESCHSSGYTGTSQDCYSCHQNDFQNPNNDPNHITANFSHECKTCHTTAGWQPAQFDHGVTAFPLTGKHTTTSCESCHSNGYTGTSQVCYSCHQEDFQNPNNDPNHITANFSQECKTCHTTVGWQPAQFDHGTTAFPLTGKHVSVSCASCHSSGYTGTSQDCYSCHQQDFQNPNNDPNHITANYPTECSVCHSTNGWSPSLFNHNNTEFPLTGKHITVSCQACHTSGYVGTPQECYSCHQADFQNPDNDPNHMTANFPTDCLVCHTTNGWSPSTFNHNNTEFPLTGRHTTVSCQSCHANGYVGTPQICYSCHQSDFQNPQNNPNHITALFPTDCIVCHTTNGWSPSSFNHDVLYFPIYSGEHRNEWNSCSDCHRTPNTFTTFSCIDCHEHRKSKMDSEHNGVNGYSYNSIACLNCHPNGTSDKIMNKRVLD
ncbi:MAG: hypothetical protein Q8N03_02055 [Ignavibacteria bacterium]|nr:hypothetical protein [Ignavibacteria bacterium]